MAPDKKGGNIDTQRVPPPFTPRQRAVFMGLIWLVAAGLTVALYPVAFWVGCRTSGDALNDSLLAGIGLAWGTAFQAYMVYAIRSWRRAKLVSETYVETAKKLWLMLPTIWLTPTIVLFLISPWLWRFMDLAFSWLDARSPS